MSSYRTEIVHEIGTYDGKGPCVRVIYDDAMVRIKGYRGWGECDEITLSGRISEAMQHDIAMELFEAISESM